MKQATRNWAARNRFDREDGIEPPQTPEPQEPEAPATPARGPVTESFLTAGHAIFTVANPTGERYTFKVTRKDPEAGSQYTQPIFFAALLTGPDNTRDYTYMGIFKPVSLRRDCMLKLTAKSKYTQDSKPVKVFCWVTEQINLRKPLPDGYTLHHEGRCARCGRTLTVPESIESGFGPECIKFATR